LHHKLTGNLGEIWHCSLSQTYNILTRLERQGYIEGTIQVQEKRPDKRELRLTASGLERFETWLGELSACSVRAIRVEFTTRLYFLHARNPASAVQAINRQATALGKSLARLRTDLEATPSDQVFNRLGLSLRISQLETLVSWLELSKESL